jgi:hypothetical protein
VSHPPGPQQRLERADSRAQVQARDDTVVGVADGERGSGVIRRRVHEPEHAVGERRQVVRDGQAQPFEEAHPHEQVLGHVVVVVHRLLAVHAVREVLPPHLRDEEGRGRTRVSGRPRSVGEEDARREEADELAEEVVVGGGVAGGRVTDEVGLLGHRAQDVRASGPRDRSVPAGLEGQPPRQDPQGVLEGADPVDAPVAGVRRDPV